MMLPFQNIYRGISTDIRILDIPIILFWSHYLTKIDILVYLLYFTKN